MLTARRHCRQATPAFSNQRYSFPLADPLTDANKQLKILKCPATSAGSFSKGS